MSSEQDEDHTAGLFWVRKLPTFDQLAPPSTSTLLHPFSRFSISSFFRSSPTIPSLPPSTLLDSIITYNDGGVELTSHEVVKHFLVLKDYTIQLRDAILHHKLTADDRAVIRLLERLAQAYHSIIYISAQTLWPERQAEKPLDNTRTIVDIANALTDTLIALFTVRQILVESDRLTTEIDQHLLGCIFPTKETKFHHLSPLLSHPRRIITALQAHPSRPIANPKFKSTLPSPVTTSHLDVTDEDMVFILDLLDHIICGINNVDILSGPIMAKNKREREEDIRRPRRVRIEVEVLKCDLLLSMTTKKIGLVKARALSQLNVPSDMRGVKPEGAGDAEEENDAKREEDEAKPRLSEESDLSIARGGVDRAFDVKVEECDPLREISWEDKAAQALLDCLLEAKKLVEEGRAEVLSAHIEAVDWMCEGGIVDSKETRGASRSKSKSTSKSMSPSHGHSGPHDTSETDTDSNSDSDDSETDSESSVSDLGGPSYPCPLRTLFRLHDRYEEQRLAVWLHLPVAQRGKMGWFMRGEEGKIGSAWDGLGLGLLIEYDSETLFSHGLAVDKLDKWVELAAARNTKKIRRRGRKTV